MTRVNPFDDLSDFEPKTQSKPIEPAHIERLAEDNGFPSRQPAAISPQAVQPFIRLRRRYTTGRNQQINIKATAKTIDTLYRLADERHVPLGELLEMALRALEQAGKQE
jgi:hypothetical protein